MKPAIFNTEMVRAILDGRKTQTRRVVNNVPKSFNFQRCGIDRTHGSKTFGKFVAIFDDGNFSEFIASPHKVGDIIYVRETWSDYPQNYIWHKADFPLHYDAEQTEHGDEVHIEADDVKWKPSIHMPKEYARLFLRVKDVRIERLNEISEEDAIKEGIERFKNGFKSYGKHFCENTICPPIESFSRLWESIYGKDSFDNRYVWVIEFERISKEETDK